MKEETQSKYLGDILHTSGKIKFIINDRVAKGHGIISEIMSIIEEIPFGHRRVLVGLILRNINSLMEYCSIASVGTASRWQIL